MTTVVADTTFFVSLVNAALKAAEFNRDDSIPPAAVLWTDEKREWEKLVPRLRAEVPQFLILGEYDEAQRTGPAIWLRCVLAGTIAGVTLPSHTAPIIYMPGVSRPTLRATEDCPPELKALAELQYRGVFFSQHNGKDWTLAAFLQTNHGGLQLRVARDKATATSLRRCIEQLADVSVEELRTRSQSGELSSAYFDSLVTDDLVDDLLTWMSDPKGTRSRWEASRWETLCSRAIADYSFDPARDGELTGAELLGLQDKPVWKTAWKRYAVVPGRYPGLAALLRQAKPAPKAGSLFDSLKVEFWPQDNDAEEATLRTGLSDVVGMSLDEARKTLVALEASHGIRRTWVWAKLQQSQLALAIEQLALLASATRNQLSGASTKDLVRAYCEEGWKADAAALQCLATVSALDDRALVADVVSHVYSPWLRDAAELFQQRVHMDPLPGRAEPRLGNVPAGTCVLFVDGLRYDVGQLLKSALEKRVGAVQLTPQFTALPSVTPTSKPAVSPVAGKIIGSSAGEDFRPSTLADGKDLTPDRFRKLLADESIQYLELDETGKSTGRAWTEFGNLDQTGHHEGIGLARRIPELIVSIVHRVESLLAAGWREVRIVTDHGWLLMPNGLPKSDLPKFLTATRWRRCAVVKPSASVELNCYSWFWSDDVRIASPPGIDCFMAGEEYSHGGLSLQECVVPQLAIVAGAQLVALAKIEHVKWAGLRCRVKISGQFSGCKVALRDKAADVSTSLVEAKEIPADGNASLVVVDDSREGSATTLVLFDAAGTVIDKLLVTVGG